jgi:hypothetical protein
VVFQVFLRVLAGSMGRCQADSYECSSVFQGKKGSALDITVWESLIHRYA